MRVFSAQELFEAYARDGEIAKAQKLHSLMVACPDLKIYEDSDGRIFFASKQINKVVDQVRFRMDGDGAPCVVYTYTVVSYEGRIHSDPPWLLIGHGAAEGFGIIPTETWSKEAKEAGLPKAIIKKISDYLARRPPVLYGE